MLEEAASRVNALELETRNRKKQQDSHQMRVNPMKRRKRTHVDDLDKESGAVQRRAIVAQIRLKGKRSATSLPGRQSLKERTGEGENAIAIF